MPNRARTVTGLGRATWTSAVFLAVVAVGERRARGDIYQTGFEAPTFTANQTVDGQGGFSVTTGTPSAITISTVQPNSGAQDLLFTGRALSDSPPPNGPGFFVGTAGIATNYDAGLGSPLVLEASILLSGPSTATGVGHTGDLVSINLEAMLSDKSYFSTYLSSDGNAYGFSTNYDAMMLVAPGVYHDLKLVLDFGKRTSTYVVDGVTFGSKAFDASVTSTILASAQFTMYAIDPPADRTKYTARVDDFSLRSVPEPASLVLCLIGGLAAAGAAHRRGRAAKTVSVARSPSNGE